MPLNLLQKKKLEGIIKKMVANGESEANIDTLVQDYKDQIETEQQRQADQQPAYQMGGNWSNFLPGIAQGALIDFPTGMMQMGEHALSAAGGNVMGGGMDLARDIYGGTIGMMEKASRPMEMLQSTPEDIGRSVGQVGAGALLGKLGGEVAGRVGKFAAPESTLAKVNAMTRNAYGGELEPALPGQPSSLDYAQPYLLDESAGKPWIDLQHHTIIAANASEKFSNMMRGLENQFKGVPIDIQTLKTLFSDIVGKIPTITSSRLKGTLTNWVSDVLGSVNDLGDFLQKRGELNERLRTYYQKEKLSQRNAMGDPKAATDVNTVNGIRDSIDSTIDQHAGGNINARAMYQIESALKDVRDAGPKALKRNANILSNRLGGRFGATGGDGTGQATAEAGQALAGGARSPYLIGRVAKTVAGPMIDRANLPDNLISTAGKLMQEGGIIRQPGSEAVQSPMSWWQNPPPPVNPPNPAQAPPGGGVQGVSPGVAGSMPPAVRQPMVGQVVNPGGVAPPPPATPPRSVGAPGGMSPLVQVGPGRWVAQDVLNAGNPPGQVGAGRTLGLPAQSLSTASEMELNQAAINRPASRTVGKPPRSTWRMKPDVRAAQPQPGELDVTAPKEAVETKPYEVIDKRTQFTAPPENPTAPSSMQEQPINREDIITPPEGPTKKVGKPPRPLKVKDVRTIKPTESELNRSQGEGLDEPIVEKAPDWPGIGEGHHIRWPEMDKGSTVYVRPGETLADKIEQFKSQFPRQ